jgi:methylenetetrahydrofolate dehydrogenase (NADP+)/methenyltetrahydrofolate cyclohydrolase
MQIFDGKYHAAKIDSYIKERLLSKPNVGKLLIVLIGDNEVSKKYIKVKMNLCASLGVEAILEHIDSNLSDEVIFEKIKTAFADKEVSGGLIQLPLPRKSLMKSLDLIPPKKDVDLLSSTNVDRYYSGSFNLLPPVVRAFNYYFHVAARGDLKNTTPYITLASSRALLEQDTRLRTIRILGNGLLVGKPIINFLKSIKTLDLNNEKFHNGDKINSEFLILGTGIPKLLKGTYICKKCNVIDFGTSSIDGKIVGDLDKESQCNHLGLVSFSPGGIGPVVVRFLILNFLDLQK